MDGYLVVLDEAVNWTETGRERFRGGWDAMVEFRSSGSKERAALLRNWRRSTRACSRARRLD